MVKVIKDENFEVEVLSGEDIVVVDFWATWCGPCKMIAPVMEELSSELEGQVKFVKIDVDDNPVVSQKYRIASIPTIMVFKNGSAVDTVVGFRPKQALKDMIKNHM